MHHTSSGALVGRIVLMIALAMCALAGCGRSPSSGAQPTATPEPAAVGGTQPVRIDAAGAGIPGRTYGRLGPSAIVLVADVGRAADVWDPLARELAAAGFFVFTVAADNVTAPEGVVRAAVAYVRGRGADKVAVIAEGVAGGAALVASAEQRVNGVAALSAPATYQTAGGDVDVTAAVPRIDAVVFVLGAQGDADSAATARRLYDAAREPRTLALAPGTAHGADIVQGPDSGQARDLLRDFLREAFAVRTA